MKIVVDVPFDRYRFYVGSKEEYRSFEQDLLVKGAPLWNYITEEQLPKDETLALKIDTFNKIYDSFFQDTDLGVFLHNVSIYMNSYNQELAKIEGIDVSD